jgi:hypothetical protein
MVQILRKWYGALVGLTLVILGSVGLARFPDGAVHGVSEAVLIAGILTVTVDPYLKSRLLREASHDVFHHLLGFDLPLEIRDRLKEIVLKTNLYRKDMTARCTFEETTQGVKIRFEMRYEVINPTNNSLKFHQHFGFLRSENPRLESISCTEAGESYGRQAALRLTEDGWEYDSRPIKIEPRSKTKKRYWFNADYTVELPSPGFYVHTFANPTIGFTLSAKVSASLTVRSNTGTRKGDQWINEGLFMDRDHIDIEWEPCRPAQEATPVVVSEGK